MELHAQLVHAEAGCRVVAVSARLGEINLGTALGEGATAEEAEDRARQRLLLQLGRRSGPLGPGGAADPPGAAAGRPAGVTPGPGPRGPAALAVGTSPQAAGPGSAAPPAARSLPPPSPRVIPSRRSGGPTPVQGLIRRNVADPSSAPDSPAHATADAKAVPGATAAAHPPAVDGGGPAPGAAGGSESRPAPLPETSPAEAPGPESSAQNPAALDLGADAAAAGEPSLEPDPGEEPPADPEDWSSELAAVELQLRRLGWNREQESLYLQRAFSHPSRSRLTRYSDLLAYLTALEALPPGADPSMATVPLRRSELLAQGDALLAGLGWGPEQGRRFLEEQLQRSHRHQLSDAQLLAFNMLLETELLGLTPASGAEAAALAPIAPDSAAPAPAPDHAERAEHAAAPEPALGDPAATTPTTAGEATVARESAEESAEERSRESAEQHPEESPEGTGADPTAAASAE